jgi:hypothetical protein
LDELGNVAIEFKYIINDSNDITSFSCGLALIKRGNKYGFIDKNENQKINFKYDSAYSGFSEGLAAVELNGKWGFIDENGNCVIPFKFDEVNSFSNGLAWVLEGDKNSCINNIGEYVIEFQHYAGTYKLRDGLIGVEQNGKWGFIDINQKV